MQLEILPHTTPRPVGSRNAFNMSRLAPGDLIQARILSISPDGKSLLQVGAAKVLSEHSFGGKVGDALLFEVQPNPQSGKPEGQTKTSLSIRLSEGARNTNHLSGRPLSGKMNSTLIGPASRSVATHPLRPLASGVKFNSTNADLIEVTSSRLVTVIAAFGNKWIRGFRRHWSARMRRDTPTDRISPPVTPARRRTFATTGSNPANGSDIRDAETPLDYSSSFWIEPAGERRRFGRINLKTKSENASADKNGNILAASFMLSLEHTGAIEVELKMVEDQIVVDFKVATEPMREKIVTRMVNIHKALKTLVNRVYCQVRVDHLLIGVDTADSQSKEVPTEIDLKI